MVDHVQHQQKNGNGINGAKDRQKLVSHKKDYEMKDT